MFNDYDKIWILVDKKLFKTEYTKKNKIADDISKQIINLVIDNFKSELSTLDININLTPYMNSGTGTENWNFYLEELKQELKLYKDNVKNSDILKLYQNYFGTTKKNIFSYVNQITTKSTSEHQKLTSLDNLVYSKSREAISSLTAIPIDVLKIKDKYLFISKLDEEINNKYKDEIEEKIYNENKSLISDKFEIYRLKYLLELNDDIEDKIGLKQMLKFPYLMPSFIDKKLRNKKLTSHIFIEGYHGTGKTTISQQIAIAINLENSFYIDLKNLQEEILTQKDIVEIERFLNSLKHLNGILILDNINTSAYAKRYVRVCLEIANEISLKVIFISILEQHNTLKNIQTFTELFHENWEKIKDSNIYIEISSNESAKQNRFNILKNVISNYYFLVSNYKHAIINDRLLEYLDSEFYSMIYLLKLALDNQDISNLYEIKAKKAKKLIVDRYRLIIDSNNLELIHLSAYDIYFRIQEDTYDDQYIIKYPEINELLKQKKIFIVKDNNFNNNLVLYFPNQLIPLQLSQYLNNGNNRFNIFSSLKFLSNLDSLSKNNSINMLRFLVLRKDFKYVDNLLNLIIDDKSFDINSKHKINLYELSLLIITLIKEENSEQKSISFSQKKLLLLETMLKKLLFNGSDKYMIFLILNSNLKIIEDWIIILSKNIQNYKKVKLKNKNNEYIQSRYINVLENLLRTTLKIITYPKLKNKINSTDNFLDNIINAIFKYNLNNLFSKEMKFIAKNNNKLNK